MIVADPITLATSPAGQASRAIAREAAGAGSAYRLAAAVGNTSGTPRVIMGQLSGTIPAGLRLGFRVASGQSGAQVTVQGFNALSVGLVVEAIGGRDYMLPAVSEAVALTTASGHFLMAVDRMPAGDPENAEIVIVSPGTEASLQLEWFLDLRLLVAAYPTPALRARLRRPRTAVTSITGRQWITERTTEPVLESLRVALNNEYRGHLPGDLAQLDEFSQFSVWPAGFERAFRERDDIIAHRQHDFVRDCAIRSWTGWRGHGDIDIHGATGEMIFSEIPWPSSARLEIPTATLRPTLPGVEMPPEGMRTTQPHGAGETPATWDGGIPIDWAPDTGVGWEND